MSYWIAGAMIVASVAQTYTSNQNAKAALKQQESAQQDAKSAALKQEKAADEANNAANRKSPDTNALLSAAMNSGKTGISSTMLTGSSGVDPNKLQLGRSNLLGG